MRRLMLFEKFQSLLRIPVVPHDDEPELSAAGRREQYLRSASRELAKIHFSPGSFPKRDPSGSCSITYSMALPTRPVPPVTSTTAGMVVFSDGGGCDQVSI